MSYRSLAAVVAFAVGCTPKPAAEEITPTEDTIAAAPPAAAAPARAAQAPSAAPEAAEVGRPAPDFTLTDQAGERHHLSDYRGRVVVLEWTNPQCPYVQRHYQAETMKQLVARFPAERVAWLAVDSSHFVVPSDSAAWREAQGLSYPILQDADGAVGRAYQARTTPHMFVIDAEGTLRYSGAIDDDVHGRSEQPTNHVGRAVDALLAGEAPPTAQTEPYGCSVKYQS